MKKDLEVREFDEGEPCPAFQCVGTFVMKQDPCSCATTPLPPCSSCENSRIECDRCGYAAD